MLTVSNFRGWGMVSWRSVLLLYLVPGENHWPVANLFVFLMVFSATFNNISVISWRLLLLVEETGENTTDLIHISPHINKHKNDHNIWHWKPRSLLGTCIKMLKFTFSYLFDFKIKSFNFFGVNYCFYTCCVVHFVFCLQHSILWPTFCLFTASYFMTYILFVYSILFYFVYSILFYDLHFVCLQHPILWPTFCLFTASYFMTYILICLQHPILWPITRY